MAKGLDKSISITGFSSDKELAHYKRATLEIGLWESEKIVFKKYYKPSDKILDIGCGSGRTTFGLYDLGYQNIIGLDITPGMISDAQQIAKHKGLPIEFVVGDATGLEYTDETFDGIIFSFNGLMMIPGYDNKILAIKEIYRVLKPGGYFVFTTHDRGYDPLFFDFWNQQEQLWKDGLQDQRLEKFGEMIYQNKDGEEQYIHIPIQQEVKDIISNTKFNLIDTQARSQISKESPAVHDVSTECRFWILQK